MRAALLQTATGTDPLLGARALVEGLDRAAGEGAELLFTPELIHLLDRERRRARAAIVSEAADATLAAGREGAAQAGHAELAGMGTPGDAPVTLDLGRSDAVRARMPVLAHRRAIGMVEVAR